MLKQQDERKQLVSECEEMGRQLKVRSKEVERAQAEAAEAHRQLEKLKMSLSDAVGKASVLAEAKAAADKAAKGAASERDAFQAKVEKLGAAGAKVHATLVD